VKEDQPRVVGQPDSTVTLPQRASGSEGPDCPSCGCGWSWIKDSRKVGNRKKRRRECTHCGQRFTSYESVMPKAA
jgi:hypothetical protein